MGVAGPPWQDPRCRPPDTCPLVCTGSWYSAAGTGVRHIGLTLVSLRPATTLCGNMRRSSSRTRSAYGVFRIPDFRLEIGVCRAVRKREGLS